MWKELTTAISHADWIGIRAVKEISSKHSVRNGLPKRNGKTLSMGGMIEVIFKGSLRYAATNSLILSSLQNAAEIPYQQALAASEFWIYPFRENTRPKLVGEYNSPLFELLDAISTGEINESLIRLCRKYKN